MDYRTSSHTGYDLKCHSVWITKYRKPVLRGQIALRLRELIRQTCETNDIYIEKGHVATDHMHLLVLVPPQIAVSEMMQWLKGRSARKMLQEFNELRRQFWGQHLWARGYFVASSGNMTDEIIKQYIESQGQQPSADDKDFMFLTNENGFSRTFVKRNEMYQSFGLKITGSKKFFSSCPKFDIEFQTLSPVHQNYVRASRLSTTNMLLQWILIFFD